MRGVGLAAGLVAFFLLRTFYFTWFECRPAGATPGKRLLGLRVIDAHGGTLTPEAVFTRNFMREIELFAPLALALGPEAVLPGHPGWVRLAGSAWLFVFSAMPLFNRDRLRVGDLVAGTLVVRAPRAVLLEDLSAAPARGPRASAPLAFSPAQLDLYGIRELHAGPRGAPPGEDLAGPGPRGGGEKDPAQDRVAGPWRAGRRPRVPARVLHRPAGAPGAAPPARGPARDEAVGPVLC
jgi:uncharacterized RDD family membrane protein YckC